MDGGACNARPICAANSLGQVAAVEMPITASQIGLACALDGRDFTGEGHTVARLLDAMSSRDIMAITASGF